MNEKLEAPLYDLKGQVAGSVELSPAVFGVEVHEQLMLKALKRQQANRRGGTAATKTRGMIAGGGSKPWPQKGTGNARAGTATSPLWPGGGVTFGPHPRSFAIRMSAKERRRAILSALSLKREQGAILAIDLAALEAKTKEMAALLMSLNLAGKVLIILHPDEIAAIRASRNISRVKPILWSNTNIEDVLNADNILLTPAALQKIEEVWGS